MKIGKLFRISQNAISLFVTQHQARFLINTYSVSFQTQSESKYVSLRSARTESLRRFAPKDVSPT